MRTASSQPFFKSDLPVSSESQNDLILHLQKYDSKLKSDIAEYAVATRLLKFGFRVLKPIGDRLSYDLAIDREGRLIRIQVKSAWLHQNYYTVDSRRTKTNRRHMLRCRYTDADFDFAIIYIQTLESFYVMPFAVFSQYKSGITFVERNTRQRAPKS
ncbi:MAG: group I intron-associated PD-(D/E)XK endonuclease, partial [Candidatus Omnitrophota bacterium]